MSFPPYVLVTVEWRWETSTAASGRSGAVKLRAVLRGEMTARGGKQPCQRRDAPVLPDGAGSASKTGRCTRGTSALKLLKRTRASSNPVDVGWIAARTCSFMTGWGTLRLVDVAGREATVKVYGVAAAMPQGHS